MTKWTGASIYRQGVKTGRYAPEVRTIMFSFTLHYSHVSLCNLVHLLFFRNIQIQISLRVHVLSVIIDVEFLTGCCTIVSTDIKN